MITLTADIINSWADLPNGPVALCLKQKLLPVEGEGAVIFPPTYADIGYNIDTLSDGTKVCTIDSVGSQANRMEPIFKRNDLMHLVPQVTICLGNRTPLSILDAGHRLGDALVRASGLREKAVEAFAAYQNGDPAPLARLAPTSLVFGAWDSRGEGAKLSRLVNSVVRAWDIDVLHRAALYSPPTDYSAADLLGPHDEHKAEKDARSALGFQHAPATWSSNDRIPEYDKDGRPNIERRILGGIVARGPITRDVTVNLVALRKLGGPAETTLREYILGLALVASCDPQDGFLRQGCLLTLDPSSPAQWQTVSRSGSRTTVTMDMENVVKLATQAAQRFTVAEPSVFEFAPSRAREMLDEQKGGRKKKGKGKAATAAGDEDAA
jgi:CRISPR-associated protein Csb1